MTNVGIKMTLDASQVASVANTTKDAFLGMADAMKKAEEAGDWGTVSSLAGGLKDLRSASGGIANSDHAQQAQQGRQNAALANGLVSTVNQAPGIINTMGRGDFAGTAIGGLQGAGNLSRNAGRFFGEKAEEGSGLDKMAGALGAVGIGGLVVGGLAAGANALSQQWEKVMQPAMQMNAMLGKTSGSVEENTKNLRAAFDRAAEGANKFGYSAEEGMQTVMDLTRYGGTKENGVYESEAKILGFQRATNASSGNLTRFEGTMQRYGGGKDSLETAYGGTFASGLQKGQFEEFLTSVERIFQEGISKGFVKGANEIASDLSFLSKLSGGNELWKGEQGAQRYSQMSNSIANATSLASVTDILTFRAASKISGTTLRGDSDKNEVDDWRQKYGSSRGNDYVDTMMLMESGLSPELLKEQRNLVQGIEGRDNRTGQIERYRQMFGLNYTGAAQVYDMLGTATDEDFKSDKYTKKIAELKENPKYVSNESRLMVATENISTNMARIGSKFMDMKLEVFSGIDKSVQDIRNFLIGGQYGKGIDIVNGMYTGAEWNPLGKKVAGFIDKGLDSEKNTKEYKTMEPLAKWLSERTPAERDQLNNSNALNVSTYEEFVKAMNNLITNGIPKVGGMPLSSINNTVDSLIGSDKTNWQTKKLLEDMNKKIDNPSSLGDDSIESKMVKSLHDRFSTEEGLKSFINSDGFSAISNAYNNRKPGDSEADKYILDALDKAMKAYNKVSFQISDPKAFQLGANTADSSFTSDWNTAQNSTFAKASQNSESSRAASSGDDDGLTPDLIRRLVASMDGLAARFDRGLVVDAYGSA
jgi:hypothetical protein